MTQFCKRQPAACEVGGQAATVIGQRAQEGARKIYQIMTDKKPAEPTEVTRLREEAVRNRQEGPRPHRLDRWRWRRSGAVDAASHDTLMPNDLLADGAAAP